MTQKNLFLVLLIISCCYTPQLFAEKNKTMSLGFYQIEYSEPEIPTLKPTMLSVYGSYRVWEGIRIEGRLAYSLHTSEISVDNNTFEVDLSVLSGLYIKYHPLDYGRLSPYVIAGMTYGEIEFNQTRTEGARSINSVVYHTDSFSYGLGADIILNNKFSTGLEYMNYFDERQFEVTAITLNLTYHF